MASTAETLGALGARLRVLTRSIAHVRQAAGQVMPDTGPAITGTAIVDFGPFPGACDAAVVVTGQAGIAAGSLVGAWIRPEATADHSHDEHVVDPPHVVAGSIVAGTGFTIYGSSNNALRHHGQYRVAWAWS